MERDERRFGDLEPRTVLDEEVGRPAGVHVLPQHQVVGVEAIGALTASATPLRH